MAGFIPKPVGNSFKGNYITLLAPGPLAPGNYKGSYEDPETRLELSDLSRKFILAVPKKDLKRLRDFFKKEGAIFRQKYIYFESAGKVELLEVNYEKILRNYRK